MFFLITNNIFMTSFIYFIIYSFIGFIIETIYTLLTKGVFKMKKCFMLNFLCPVYGVGALLILYTTRKFRKKKTSYKFNWLCCSYCNRIIIWTVLYGIFKCTSMGLFRRCIEFKRSYQFIVFNILGRFIDSSCICYTSIPRKKLEN